MPIGASLEVIGGLGTVGKKFAPSGAGSGEDVATAGAALDESVATILQAAVLPINARMATARLNAGRLAAIIREDLLRPSVFSKGCASRQMLDCTVSA